MPKHRAAPRSTAPVLVLLLLGLAPLSAALAEVQEVTETFTSWTRRDPAFTTAAWDTLAGELHLPLAPLAARGSINTLGTAYSVAAAGSRLLVCDGSGGLLAIDGTNPDAPAQVDQLALADQARAAALVGGWAYVAVGNAGLQAVDVSDPANLAAGVVADCPGFAQAVAVLGGYAYVAQGASGVAVYDLGVAGAPVHLADVAGLDVVRGVAAADGRLLAADGMAGLSVLTLADPVHPARIDTLDTPGVCQSVAVRGGLAFLADGAYGLKVVDLDAPGGAAVIASLGLPGTAMTVSVAGDTVLVAGGNGGLHLVDVGDPTAPALVGTAASANWAYHALAFGGHLWLADGSAGLRAFTADPFGLDEGANQARSLDLNLDADPVRRVRLAADFTDSVRFFVSGDAGAHWLDATPDGAWIDLDPPTLDVRWRALLQVADGWPGPVVRSVTIGMEKDVSHAVITGVTDVPDDGGGQVRVRWDASRHDAAGAQYVVTEYALYRRIDLGKRWPAGEWEYLLSVPADREETYAAVAPTLYDSVGGAPAWSVYFVRTRTSVPGVFFDSPPDSGQSVDNLRPAPPTGFLVGAAPGGGIDLQWHAYADPDFAHFRVYRSAVDGAEPSPAALVHVTTSTSWHDDTPGTWFYDLTVVDLAGRESLPADVVSAVPGDGGAGRDLVLGPAVPNPANPRSVVRFRVPAGGADVQVTVYDARGRRVARLHDGWLAEGDHALPWDGRDDRGRSVPSGVYAVRLQDGAAGQVLKLTIIR
ncbi:MAG TPA: FlgD immunoglobulin-like domain containing protein [Candidatus Krumholzibacteria bacterium]|nr:FlgD immunoglobulin-like domain containing protein [Candidatus Krumholzibacteria bacterium]